MHTVATPQSFVDTLQSAEFLGLTPRRVLDLARAGKLPFYPLGTVQRRMWRFRLSELVAALSGMAAGMGISVPNEPRAGDRKRMRLKGKQLPRRRFRIVWDGFLLRSRIVPAWKIGPSPSSQCAKTFFARILLLSQV